MSVIIENKKTEIVLRKILEEEGFILLNPPRKNGETGADIEAKKDGKRYFIEVIGFKKSPPARSRDFYEVFFRAISRIKDDAEYCIIALPNEFGRGLSARANWYNVAWMRIGDAFPELEIWLIDTREEKCKKTNWNEWLKNKL